MKSICYLNFGVTRFKTYLLYSYSYSETKLRSAFKKNQNIKLLYLVNLMYDYTFYHTIRSILSLDNLLFLLNDQLAYVDFIITTALWIFHSSEHCRPAADYRV